MEKTKLDENEVSPEVVAMLAAKGTPPAAEQSEQPKQPESVITSDDIQQFINKKKSN